MLKKTRTTLLSAAVAALALVPMPVGNAAVGQILTMLPSGAISCDQAANHWTSDADYQAKVAQAQALAAMDPRGNDILAALGRVDAAAEQCGLKGTTGNGDGGSAAGGAGSAGGSGDAAPGAAGGADSGNPDRAVSSDGGAGAGSAAGGTGGSGGAGAAATTSGSGGTPEAPVADAEAVLGPIRNNPGVPTKTIEVLGQGQVEVADADAMMSNFLRQFTIVI